MSMPPPPTIKPRFPSSIWKQLVIDAPFAWHLRDDASKSPAYRLHDLDHFDRKLDDYLDALRIDVETGRPLHRDLKMATRGAVFVAAVLGLSQQWDALIDVASENVRLDKSRAEELAQAVAWTDADAAQVERLARSGDEQIVQAAVVPLLGGAEPHIGDDQYRSQHPLMLIRLLDYIGQYRLRRQAWRLVHAYDNVDADVQLSAARAGLLLGDVRAGDAIERLTEHDHEKLREALELNIRLGHRARIPTTVERVRNMSVSPRIKALAIATSGLPEYIPLLLKAMEHVSYAQVAGEAFSMVTGANITDDDLDGESPRGEEPTAAQKRAADKQYRSYEEVLPWPDPDKVRHWWEARRHYFDPGRRYLAGLPIEQRSLRRVLREGTQPQRYSAALELSRLNTDTPLFDTRIRARWQLQQMGEVDDV